MVSLTPAPPSDLDSCTLTWEESLCHWLPPFPPSLDTGAWPGGWRWQQVLLLSWQPRPSSHPELPGSRTTERQLWAVPHWPSLGLRSPAPAPIRSGASPSPRHSGLGKALSAQDHRGQPGWTGLHSERGRLGQPSPPQDRQCAPWAVQPPATCPVSATTHRAPPHPPHAPSCQSRCRVWCRAFFPKGWVGSTSPPICSLPGAFLCRFLNVILK